MGESVCLLQRNVSLPRGIGDTDLKRGGDRGERQTKRNTERDKVKSGYNLRQICHVLEGIPILSRHFLANMKNVDTSAN